jgi:hypothetical protein
MPRKTLFRLSVGAGLLGALLAYGSCVYPTWSARLGLNLTPWLDAQRDLAEACRRRESLNEYIRWVQQDLEAKSRVIEDVRNDRLTLLEAAARFRDMGHSCLDRDGVLFRQSYAGQTDAERWCRKVIGYMRAVSPAHTDGASRADQLEAELSQHLAQGPLQLPD